MPEYSTEIQEKLAALPALEPKERKYAEVRAVYWPSGLKVYSIADYGTLPGYADFADGLAAALETQLGYTDPLVVTLIPDKNAPFGDLPRTASIAEDGEESVFTDIDGEVSQLVATHGEGVPLEIFGYWAATPAGDDPFDLLLSLWRGMTKAPKEMSRARLTLPASSGFRSPNMDVPRRAHATSCTFIWGGHLATQSEINFHEGCPFNVHVGGSIGILNDPSTGLPWTDCARDTVATCLAHLGTKRYWPGFDVRPDPIANVVRGRNIPASAVGNASNLSGPVRAIIGERYVKALPLLAYRSEVNTAHADKGFGAGVFEVSEGPVQSLYNFYMNGVFVGFEHQNLRLGELGQPATFFSPDINSFSATAHAFGRIQGNFNDNQAASLTASIMCRGLRNIRVYADPSTYVEQYTNKRMWAILKALTSPRWGYGNDYARYNIASAIEVADWHDETVSMHDPNGNLFTGPRSTCNVELNGRAVQQQLNDLCVAGRVGLPFEFNGLDTFVPLKKETLDDTIPTFTDEGPNRNIIYSGADSTLRWSYTSDTELINQWTVNFDDASNGFVETQLIFGDQRAQLRAGRAAGDRSIKVNNKSQPAFGITNFSEAARFGVFLLYLGPLDSGGVANPWEIKFTTWYSDAFFVQMYKPIRVLNSKLQQRTLDYYTSPIRVSSFPWFSGEAYEYFRVKKLVRKGDLKVEITAQLYAHDFMERIEDVTEVPPVFVSPGIVNPGGRRDEQPERILPVDLIQSGDRITGSFEVSAY